jgi:hypothetical protein
LYSQFGNAIKFARLILKKDVAKISYERLHAVGAELSAVLQIFREIEDEIERRELLRGIGGVMLDIANKLIVPILLQYPDLDPDNEYATRKK